MLVIPAVDIRGGRCVRLRQGDPQRETVYGDDPVAMARRWADEGAELVHIVDLDGAIEGGEGNAAAIEAIGAALPGRVQVGGGIRSTETVRRYTEAGVQRVIVGTRAVEDLDWFRGLCGEFAGRVCVGIDSRDGNVAVRGWREATALGTLEAVRMLDGPGIAAIIYTDIRQDGMLAGPNLDAIREVTEATATPVIAAGGVSSVADIRALRDLPVHGAITGKALYSGDLDFAAALRVAAAPSGS